MVGGRHLPDGGPPAVAAERAVVDGVELEVRREPGNVGLINGDLETIQGACHQVPPFSARTHVFGRLLTGPYVPGSDPAERRRPSPPQTSQRVRDARGREVYSTITRARHRRARR